MKVKLPNGLVDGGDLFNIVEIDELRGQQQDYLIDQELVNENIGHLPKILADMCKKFKTESGVAWKGSIADEAIWKIPSGDIETILVKIRENTYGPRYFHEAECTHCGHRCKDLELKLDQLKVTSLTVEELLKPKVIFLPKEEVEVELKPAYLEDLMESINIMKNKQNSLTTAFLAASIKRIGENTKITEKDVAKLRASDIDFIKDKSEEIKLEGYIDTDIEITCQNKDKSKGKKVCGKDFTVKLNCFDPTFFYPTKG